MTRRKRTGAGNALGRFPALVFVALLVALGWWLQEDGQDVTKGPQTEGTVAISPAVLPQASLPAYLPPEARATLAFIERDGPFPHPQDGGVFGNREGHLPQRERGFYREYTVETPGLDYRGARRIVTGGRPPRVY